MWTKPKVLEQLIKVGTFKTELLNRSDLKGITFGGTGTSLILGKHNELAEFGITPLMYLMIRGSMFNTALHRNHCENAYVLLQYLFFKIKRLQTYHSGI